MVKDGQSVRVKKRIPWDFCSFSGIRPLFFSDQAKTISNLHIITVSVTSNISPDVETTVSSSENINHTSLEDEIFSVLEPPPKKVG